MEGRELWHPKHWFGCRGNCPGCQVGRHYNLFRRFCHCGAPATGYRAMGLDVDVEFFCDEHFVDVPETRSPDGDGQRLAEAGNVCAQSDATAIQSRQTVVTQAGPEPAESHQSSTAGPSAVSPAAEQLPTIEEVSGSIDFGGVSPKEILDELRGSSLVSGVRVEDVATIEQALEARRWVDVLCGACGHQYHRCSYCGVGVQSKTCCTLAKCGGHRDEPCFKDCRLVLALTALARLRSPAAGAEAPQEPK